MYQRALAGKEKALGPEHTSTLDTVHNLGVLYSGQGKLAEAEAMYQRALAGNEKALGPEHTSTLDTAHNLGVLYRDQDKLAEAEAMYQRALAGKEKVLGPEHTSTLSTAHNLGVLYRDQGKLVEAEAVHQLFPEHSWGGGEYVKTPIHEFESILEFLVAHPDVIKDHESLHRDGKIFHYEISANYVDIVDVENALKRRQLSEMQRRISFTTKTESLTHLSTPAQQQTMPFAQLVIGPPGSGKSTYCNGMHQFLSAIGRKCSVVNLDPANDETGYPCALDVRDLVTLEEVMAGDGLGPNGGVLYALEEVEGNVEWLEKGLGGLGVLHLTDSYCLTLPSLYISTVLLSLRAMLQMDLPHLNVLTKIDNLTTYAPLPFNLDFYTEVHDLSYLLPHLAAESPILNKKFEGLNEAIIDLVDGFSLVGFETLAVEDKRSMMHLLQVVDRAGGYAFGGPEGANDTVWQVAMREGTTTMDVRDVQERWVDAKEEYDEAERRMWEEEAKARGEVVRGVAGGGQGEADEMDGLEDIRGPMVDGGVKVRRMA
ncbi:hypothetical protein FGG08_007587 [Glutinoglossum americanum]|uniref:Fungal-type protein kinase domain-containing protein n=1 Tax=Glutinoglossum americanum TaxID=1670608 RepID=A0A9P8HQH4_9PEZI|nr:hypothetical protein FGG08_007587 [Glutinoglossum americanum]